MLSTFTVKNISMTFEIPNKTTFNFEIILAMNSFFDATKITCKTVFYPQNIRGFLGDLFLAEHRGYRMKILMAFPINSTSLSFLGSLPLLFIRQRKETYFSGTLLWPTFTDFSFSQSFREKWNTYVPLEYSSSN